MLWNFSLIWDRHHKQVDWFHLNDIGGTLDSKKWRWYSYISRSDITFDLTILLKCLWKSQRSARTTYRILHERLIIGVWPLTSPSSDLYPVHSRPPAEQQPLCPGSIRGSNTISGKPFYILYFSKLFNVYYHFRFSENSNNITPWCCQQIR